MALIGYGHDAALATLKILAPLGCATVVVAHALALARGRVGSLRRQFAVVAVVAMVQLTAAVVLFVDQMFVSGHDAFFAVLAAAYATALTAWAMHLLGRRALDDVDAVRTTLTLVGEGRRDVRTGVGGRDELARLAADVDAMVARLDSRGARPARSHRRRLARPAHADHRPAPARRRHRRRPRRRRGPPRLRGAHRHARARAGGADRRPLRAHAAGERRADLDDGAGAAGRTAQRGGRGDASDRRRRGGDHDGASSHRRSPRPAATRTSCNACCST